MSNAGAPESIGRMLLVSPSSLTMYQVAKSAHRFPMSVEVCTNARTALDLVNRQKFDAVTVDLSLGHVAVTILREMRLPASQNRTAVAFAISGNKGDKAAAFAAGSSFVLGRPLTFDSIRWTLQAAHGLILRERRRYFRCPIAMAVSIQQEGMPPVSGETEDISEGGIALRIPAPLTPGAEATVQFTLPGSQLPIRAEVKICWYNEQCHAGLSFLALSPHDCSELEGWIARRFEELADSSQRRSCGEPIQTRLSRPHGVN
jgi:DNA-binding NarL/FixJ family response regulator